ncbi:FISUMP domain-containing protein [Dysgonomonas sp. 25]|uniref:FISUMP domain-containing protein n=1 Tax=Dysgonomonas sp. 25 TaxID=2302933 RepID=UPI0013CFA4B2|nr:FISUMP domain-containing protein [Dysgonomonas sp. 25]NDV70219.1 hypothetical protein [Dysgonomonas sp. 25]
MKRTILTQAILILAFLTTTIDLHGQVTIGSGEKPNAGALLDLKMDNQGMSTKGLGLPRVELKDIKTKTDLAETMGLPSGTLNAADHAGLVVYNIGKDEVSLATRFCPGLHVWDGTEWQVLGAYPEMGETRILQSTQLKGFTHLDPSNTAHPMWATLGKNPASYPLGYIGQFTDNRPNDAPQTYHYTRFYVGYTEHDNTFNVTRDISCAQDGSAIVTSTETVAGSLTFEDGVWMAENLRAIKMPDGTAIAQNPYGGEAVGSTTSPRYYYPNNQAANRATLGVLYNWPAAINMGTGPGQTPDPPGGGLANVGLDEANRIQGICPAGWHLPSDRQWTDLENGIIINTSKFSSTPDIGGALLPYSGYIYPVWRGTSHGRAMKATGSTINGLASNGTSKSAAQGGFELFLAGNGESGAFGYYGGAAIIWSSSRMVVRYFANTVDKGCVGGYQSGYLLSVRCKKDD